MGTSEAEAFFEDDISPSEWRQEIVKVGISIAGVDNHDWREGLNVFLETLLPVVFAPDQESILSNETGKEFTSGGGRPFELSECFLAFLASRGHFEEEQVQGERLDSAALVDCYKSGGKETRYRMLTDALFGIDPLWDWLNANNGNRLEFWNSIAPGKPLPDCVPEAKEFNQKLPGADVGKVEPGLSSTKKRGKLKAVCGKPIANDIGDWDGARSARYGVFLAETSEWLRNINNVKKLLPADGMRHGERAVNRHLIAEFGFKLAHSTLKKYGFIK